MNRITVAFLATTAFAAYAQSDPIPTPVVTLIPAGGNLAGAPGTVVGWGFTFTYNALSDWAILTGSQFTGSPVYGTYFDYLGLPTSPLYVAGPSPESSTVEQAWSPSANPPLGIGEFDINPTALTGANIAGDIVVHYSVFSQDPNDPNFDPDTSTVIADATLSEPAQVTVLPEPSSLRMIGALLIPFAFATWRGHKLSLQ